LRLTPDQILLANLSGNSYLWRRARMSKESAHKHLVEKYNVDFGYDVRAWKKHIKSVNKKR